MLMRALLADPLLAGIPVVVISAAQNVAQEVAGLGVRAFFEKPFDLRALLRTIERHC